MADKRIKKTKKYLKDTLIQLLNESPFEEITVTRICQAADISRITFYSHYSDKYDLVDEIFQDMIAIGKEQYRQTEHDNNPNGEIVQGFINVLTATLNLYYDQFRFFQHTNPDTNPYLAFTFFNHLLNTVEHHTCKESSHHKLKYSNRQITGFLCFGLLGFINESQTEKMDVNQVQQASKMLLTDILEKGILF